MRDRRRVDELSLEELEQVVHARRRQERLERVRYLVRRGKEAGPVPADRESRRTSAPGRATRPREPEGGGPQSTVDPRGPQAATRAAEGTPDRPERQSHLGRLRERILLTVEVALAVGLLAVLIGSLVTLRQLNEASIQARALLVPTATPLIRVKILPGGHTPPDSPGGSAPEEIPAHLRDRMGAITPLPMPTRGPEHAIRIRIPAIDVDAPVVEGDDWEALKQGAGHHVGSANPGERGNCIISAHNDIFGEIFRRLRKVDLGDEVLVHTVSQVYRYVVTQKRIVEPEDVDVMHPTSGPVLTLISCHPYGIDTHRIVVTAELQT